MKQEHIEKSKWRASVYASILELIESYWEKEDPISFAAVLSIARTRLKEGMSVEDIERESEEKALTAAHAVYSSLEDLFNSYFKTQCFEGEEVEAFGFLVEHAMNVETEYVQELVDGEEQ